MKVAEIPETICENTWKDGQEGGHSKIIPTRDDAQEHGRKTVTLMEETGYFRRKEGPLLAR